MPPKYVMTIREGIDRVISERLMVSQNMIPAKSSKDI